MGYSKTLIFFDICKITEALKLILELVISLLEH